MKVIILRPRKTDAHKWRNYAIEFMEMRVGGNFALRKQESGQISDESGEYRNPEVPDGVRNF